MFGDGCGLRGHGGDDCGHLKGKGGRGLAINMINFDKYGIRLID